MTSMGFEILYITCEASFLNSIVNLAAGHFLQEDSFKLAARVDLFLKRRGVQWSGPNNLADGQSASWLRMVAMIYGWFRMVTVVSLFNADLNDDPRWLHRTVSYEFDILVMGRNHEPRCVLCTVPVQRTNLAKKNQKDPFGFATDSPARSKAPSQRVA